MCDKSENKHNSVKIAVAAHKKYRMPDDEAYVPIFVGAALNHKIDVSKEMQNCVRDDIEVNISELNHSLCELTGLYWAWKNLDAGFIGLCHYRRYFASDKRISSNDAFERIIKCDELCELIKHYRIILPKKRHYFIESLESHYAHTHDRNHLSITRKIGYPKKKIRF